MSVRDALARKRGAAPQDVLQAPGDASAAALGSQAQPEPDFLDKVLGFLPAVGGGVGGLAGGAGGAAFGLGFGGIPGALAGAGVGGAGGEAARQLILQSLGRQAPQTSEEAASAIGRQGLEQIGNEAAGGLIAKPVAFVGKTLTGKALAKASARTREIYTAATQQGVRHNGMDLVNGFADLQAEIATLSPMASERLKLVAKDFMSNKAGNLTPLRLQRIKQVADEASKKIKDSLSKGQLPSPTQQLKARFYDLASNNAREMLRSIPGAQQAEAVTQRAIKARRLIPRATEGPIRPTLTNLLGTTELAGRAALSKPVLKGAGRGAEAIAPLLQQLPRALWPLLFGQ